MYEALGCKALANTQERRRKERKSPICGLLLSPIKLASWRAEQWNSFELTYCGWIAKAAPRFGLGGKKKSANCSPMLQRLLQRPFHLRTCKYRSNLLLLDLLCWQRLLQRCIFQPNGKVSIFTQMSVYIFMCVGAEKNIIIIIKIIVINIFHTETHRNG